MPDGKLLVLDANILVRAVLGNRVRSILVQYGKTVGFVAPVTAFSEAEGHLPAILTKRGAPASKGTEVLRAITEVVRPIDGETYASRERDAKRLLAKRDVDDWPVLATAMVFNCPIWTEDTDFFGAGVATWTTDRVEMFLENTAGT